MKKLFFGVLVMFSLGFAQGRLFGEALAAELSLVPGFGISANAAIGAEQVLGPLDLRGGLGFSSGGGFGLFADVLYPIQGQSLKFNLGGGLQISSGGGSAIFGLRGIAGLELPIERYFSLLIELRPIVFFVGSSGFDMGVVLGPRVYF